MFNVFIILYYCWRTGGNKHPLQIIWKQFMKIENSKILLNDILRFDDLNNVKIRFNLMFRENWNPIEIFNNSDLDILLEGQYWIIVNVVADICASKSCD